ncbi:hypothetical protein Ahy_B05g074194 isoform A [Arachis hypogaea]|uniref:F-box domain-containing protein n=1 Tax=Arachis hypogaea TaxID=3818 RepID=A0A444YYI8_ARAHY|nr:hypothetical protein Ahy_B05g074194 isoform A [Arachis hypogaea]
MANHSDQIPNDLALKILAKLPVKSLKRFNCVRKSWLNLLENPYFKSMYYENLKSKTAHSSSLLLWRLFYQRDKNVRSENNVHLLSGERYENMVTLVLPTLVESYGPGEVLECVNGIICHYARGHEVIGLWNPKTDERKIIPPGITDDEPGYDRHVSVHGFGYDNVNDDYKVIQCVYYIYDPMELEEPALTIWQIYTYLNGVCHWWGSEFATNGLEEQVLVSFNLSTETFRTTSIVWLQENDDGPTRTLVVLNDSVTLISSFAQNNSIEISILGEVGVKESWVKLFTFRFGPFPKYCAFRMGNKCDGVIWVLEQYKVSKFWLEKSAKDHKRKREVLEVSPVKKHGKIKGESLILTEHDGSETTIWLKGCVVEAVSSSSLPSKKRAKRYPIKVENNKSVVYHGSKLLYIYLETSWEKEAWCKALRMASRDQSEKLKWSSQLYEECHRYLASLNIEYHPFIMRPSAGSSFDGLEKSSKPDGSSSRIPQFLKKSSLKPSLDCGFYKINVGPSYKINLISGGAVVEIETRLEVGEPPNDKGTECSSNAGGAPSDLLEDLSNGDGVNDSQEPKVDVNGNTDVSKVSRSTSSSFYGSKWKSMLNSLAKHVSQVPLTLAIRIVSLKGIMRLQLNPPPSDNLWYGFTLMPDIDFNLESCVRDHKITNARIALFLLNRLKEAF